MRSLRLSTSLACLVAVYGLTTAPATKATISDADVSPGGSCQISIPTTNTGVRPKASGFRNESMTTGNFVICTLQRSAAKGLLNEIALSVYSLDGTARNTTCTAVIGTLGGPTGYELIYSTKTLSVSDTTGSVQAFDWTATDFGGTVGGNIPGSIYVSVTCNLPPQTAINYIVGAIP